MEKKRRLTDYVSVAPTCPNMNPVGNTLIKKLF